MNNKYNSHILITIVLIPIVFAMAVFAFQKTGRLLAKEKVVSKKDIKTENFEEFKKDTDGDGLPDAVENIFYTDINKPDTDSDGYSDKDELERDYNPLGTGGESEYKAAVKKIEYEKYDKAEEQKKAALAESPIARDDRLFKEAVATKNKKACTKIKDDIKEKGCIYDIILQEQGYASCEEIIGETEKESCQKKIKYSRAVCDQLSFHKSRENICYREGAVIFKDVSFCYEQKNRENEDFCVIDYAHFTKDASVCKTIKDSRLKKMCLSL